MPLTRREPNQRGLRKYPVILASYLLVMECWSQLFLVMGSGSGLMAQIGRQDGSSGVVGLVRDSGTLIFDIVVAEDPVMLGWSWQLW